MAIKTESEIRFNYYYCRNVTSYPKVTLHTDQSMESTELKTLILILINKLTSNQEPIN